MNKFFKISTAIAATTLAACSGSSSSTGKFTLGLTDGPVENAQAVVITFSAVELHGAESKVIEFDTPMSLDLLQLQGEARSLLLDGESFTAGDYQWVRLAVDEASSYIQIDGSQHALEIPSNAQTGLKLNRPFTIGAGSTTDFTIDFDLRKSVHQEGVGDYKLRPTLRIVDNLEVNTVSGTVAETLVTNVSCNNGDNNDIGNAVYLFSGDGATIQDLQGNSTDPLASSSVVYNLESEAYEYEIGYVPVGEYTIAFTCDASLDISTEDNSDVVNFSAGFPVNVTVEGDIVVDITDTI